MDDEIESLLAMMGSGSGQTSTSTSMKPPTTTSYASSTKKSIDSDDQTNKEKAKKRKKKRIKDHNNNDLPKKPTSSNGEKRADSFINTRLSQHCFEWPCCKNDGQRWLFLGSGLLHDCKGYLFNSKEHQLHQNGRYGSAACQACGKSAVTHELCLSSSGVEGVNDDSIKACHPLSIISVASIIVASRNARCLIGEHYPASAIEIQMKKPQMHELSKNHELLPPLNSTPSPPNMILNGLDMHVGRILVALKKMQGELSKPNHRHQKHDKMQQKEHSKLGYIASISVSDVQLLQEKTSALIKAVQDYKKVIGDYADSSQNIHAKKRAALNLVEKRLVAMASCDAVYYRCYYAAVVSHNSTSSECDSVMAILIPHPPTYFSCPGLAWDAQNTSEEVVRIFMGECSNKLDLAAPLDDSTKQVLLKSWGLKERLTVGDADGGNEHNPLLSLWQSRFLETIRHVWCTRYSRVKSSITLQETRKSMDDTNRSQVLPTNSQETVLKIHETFSASPAVTLWKDSIRDYPANFYAYAAPTNEALRAISNCFGSPDIGQILEAGAGTGYWSALLVSHLKHSKNQCKEPEKDGMAHKKLLVAYDIAPPSLEQGDDRAAVSNEYHGNIPTFTDVCQADNIGQALSASVTSSANTALLLCYPPPGSDMAQRALSTHMSNGGKTVMHIGEWQGLTGDATFEASLTQNFYCQEKDVVPLPMWGSDTTYLTIWRKKDSEVEGGAASTEIISCSPAFGYCSVKQCSNRASRRCRYARCLQYCSLECYEKHSSQRRAVLALHMIHTTSGDEVKYENDDHFMDLSSINAPETASTRSERPKKKRKKKRR